MAHRVALLQYEGEHAQGRLVVIIAAAIPLAPLLRRRGLAGLRRSPLPLPRREQRALGLL